MGLKWYKLYKIDVLPGLVAIADIKIVHLHNYNGQRYTLKQLNLLASFQYCREWKFLNPFFFRIRETICLLIATTFLDSFSWNLLGVRSGR
jgi:hypothetical protein